MRYRASPTAGRIRRGGCGGAYAVQKDSRPAAYSDLVQFDGATIGMLYETGQASWKERIDVCRHQIADVLAR